MDPLKNLIEHCRERHEKSLRQRKTVVMPSLYNDGYPYQITVYCAQRYPVLLADLEQANISFMPIGRAPDNDHGPGYFGGKRFMSRQGAQDWSLRRWHVSWGIQVYTGIPSERNGARWHDLNFTYQALCTAPDAVLTCVDALINTVPNPLLTLSKSGGLRFSCRIPEYLHPNTEDVKQFIYKHAPTKENPKRRDVYLEVLGEEGYNRWDARYIILLGNLLEPPVVDKDVLFAPIDALRAQLHEPAPSDIEPRPIVTEAPPSLGSDNLDLAKAALVKRGFSYLRQEDGFHHWVKSNTAVDDGHVLLWERDNIVWIRSVSTTSSIGVPIGATPITEVWDDTGILLPVHSVEPLAFDQTLSIRRGELSPLAIKRPPAVLKKSEDLEQRFEMSEKDTVQAQSVFDGMDRILGVATNTGSRNDETVSYLRNGGDICLSVPFTRLAEKTAAYYQSQNQSSLIQWKPRMHRWEQVKHIPVDLRMATPFQHGNVCEDPERCDALEKKGGNPTEVICPQCPVYTECQQRGYLSQTTALQSTKVQIFPIPELFFDPQYSELVEKILEPVDETERLCIVGRAQVYKLFLSCQLPKKLLEEWCENWRGSVLGNFAKALQNAIEIADMSHADAIKRIRTVVQSFEWQEEVLVRQMCQVSVPGKVVERNAIDPESGKLLARFAIAFKNDIFAYIPLDDNAASRLKAAELPFFPLSYFPVNEDMQIVMSMAEATRLGILDIETVESIQQFPNVCLNPNWTYWHQLKRFFTHYTRDADTPMRCDNNCLRFWVPPVLHPSVKRLMLMSVVLPEQHIRKAFPGEDIEISRHELTPWGAGNKVFQIRTGTYPPQSILGYNNDNWNVIGMSKIGQRFVAGIRGEIERDPSVKHAIIADETVVSRLGDIERIENVSFVTHFNNTRGLSDALKEVEVVWIVGTPQLRSHLLWRRAQTFYGNDKEPLSYDEDIEVCSYRDDRVQEVYEQAVIRVLTRTVSRVQLDRWTDKKVVLISSLPLPGITDRPETLLFDWEDFEVADGLDKLPEAIATRQHYESLRDNLTAESSREEVEQALGCSSRQANRILKEFRGGAPLRVPFRIQILSLLADGEKKTAEIVASIEGHPKAVKNELKRLMDAGEIVRVRWGIYSLPPT